jgi:teichoic acid transport system ATP-binding protein
MALWLEAGEIKAYGLVEEVVPQYEKFIREYYKLSQEERNELTKRFGEKESTTVC